MWLKAMCNVPFMNRQPLERNTVMGKVVISVTVVRPAMHLSAIPPANLE